MRTTQESSLYYLQSRYYSPAIGRFISSDAFLSTGSGIIGFNMFTYCNNNPVMNQDSAGYAIETAIDIASLSYSAWEVYNNPDSRDAWICLFADSVDLIPFVTGVGEITRATRIARNAIETVDTANDLKRAADHWSKIDNLLLDAVENTSKKGRTRNYIKDGGFNQALKDFDSLGLTNITTVSTKYGDALKGTLGDSITVILRKGSTTGGITLEFQISSRNTIKIRY